MRRIAEWVENKTGKVLLRAVVTEEFDPDMWDVGAFSHNGDALKIPLDVSLRTSYEKQDSEIILLERE